MVWPTVLTQGAYSARMGWCGWKGIAMKGKLCGGLGVGREPLTKVLMGDAGPKKDAFLGVWVYFCLRIPRRR